MPIKRKINPKETVDPIARRKLIFLDWFPLWRGPLTAGVYDGHPSLEGCHYCLFGEGAYVYLIRGPFFTLLSTSLLILDLS